ncbi:MAG: sugar ABC transporter ATP-binding protein [Ruminococcus bromii]|nr:sugar ABC transporter ATP-binding protein [Ruminococcus bromii]
MTLEMKGIYKSFGANDVLRDVSFTLSGGEICALLGENGAGKSTLMNILGGVHHADQGQIFLDGTPVVFQTPADSLKHGIAFIHQELNLVNDLAIYENMFIGHELKKKGGLLDAPRMIARTKEIFEKMDLDLDPRTMVRDLDASYKQIVEIARALLMEASIIIMDEPTTSLTEPEIRRVFDMMNTLKDSGVGIVFISHKLREVMEICTRFTVLRDGNMVSAGDIAETSIDRLAHDMVGHDVRTQSLRRAHEMGDTVLSGKGLTLEPVFRNVNFEVHAGEVLGFTGLLGDGRSELFQCIFGARRGYTGTVAVDGRELRIRSTTQALKAGIGYVPRNRKENGIIKDMSILENGSIVTWARDSRIGFLKKKKIADAFNRQEQELHIKLGSVKDLIGSLSGGNQQKVVLAKWLTANPRVLVFDNPTQGVDVGAKEEIYDIILKLADAGVAIIVLSSEAQEIIRVCDRTLVMFHGDVCGELVGDEMNEQAIMRLATGGQV